MTDESVVTAPAVPGRLKFVNGLAALIALWWAGPFVSLAWNPDPIALLLCLIVGGALVAAMVLAYLAAFRRSARAAGMLSRLSGTFAILMSGPMLVVAFAVSMDATPWQVFVTWAAWLFFLGLGFVARENLRWKRTLEDYEEACRREGIVEPSLPQFTLRELLLVTLTAAAVIGTSRGYARYRRPAGRTFGENLQASRSPMAVPEKSRVSFREDGGQLWLEFDANESLFLQWAGKPPTFPSGADALVEPILKPVTIWRYERGNFGDLQSATVSKGWQIRWGPSGGNRVVFDADMDRVYVHQRTDGNAPR